MEKSKKLISTNMSKVFENTKIFDPIKGEYIIFSSLWENNNKPLILINWLRRFG